MKKPLTPQAKKMMLRLLANTVILMVLYLWLPTQFDIFFLPLIYLGVGAALLLYYVIYNRGFSGKNVTLDMLPNTMSLEEKQQFIEDTKARMEKSKWVLTVLIPIMLVFAVDMIYLFVIPMLFGGN